MKSLIFILFYCGFCLSFSAQENKEIIEQINKLEDVDLREDAISFLNNIIDEDSSQLHCCAEILSEKMNKCLQFDAFSFSISLFALTLLDQEFMSLTEKTELSLVNLSQKIRKTLKQEENYQDWIWSDYEYLENRSNSGLILDLLGYGHTIESMEELKSAFDYFIDNRPKYFALVSLLNRGDELKADQLVSIAADDETRGSLFSHLKAIDKFELFPKAFNNQKALSRSNMVKWLVYPTELGRVPTEIKFIEKVEVEYDDVGLTDFFIWKFRADDDDWKDYGWMVGLSGPFVRSESPTMDAYGYTFSVFAKLEDKTIQEHFDEIIEVIDGVDID